MYQKTGILGRFSAKINPRVQNFVQNPQNFWKTQFPKPKKTQFFRNFRNMKSVKSVQKKSLLDVNVSGFIKMKNQNKFTMVIFRRR